MKLIATLLSLFGLTLCAKAAPLAVGAPAPDVSAHDQNGAPLALKDVFAKGPTLVYFYPKADTPGCTAQACSLRDAFPDFTKEGVQVIRVSGDKVEGQKAFAVKYNLPFTLLADSDGAVAKAFGVPAVMGIAKRQSFIVVDGKIVVVIESAKTGDHAAEVQAALVKLGFGKKS